MKTTDLHRPEGSSSAHCSPRDLAARIATGIFTNSFGDLGTRLEIKQATGLITERPIGGLCYLAAIDRIAAIIEENKKLTD